MKKTTLAILLALTIPVGAQLFRSQPANSVILKPWLTFASLGSAPDGTLRYCSNCTQTNPCAGGGAGSIARRESGTWNCGGGAGSAQVAVKKAGVAVGTRSALNLIEGANVTITAVDDAGNNEIDVTIASSGGGGGAPTDATYITQTSNGSLTNEQALSGLATGLVKNTTGTGVLSIATPGTDYAGLASANSFNKTQSMRADSDVATLVLAPYDASIGTANILDVQDDFGFPLSAIDKTGKWVGDVVGAVTGNASTATALAANPVDCGANTFGTAIAANGDLTCGGVAAAAITDDHAGTDITSDLEEENHQAEHQSGGADALAGNLDAIAKVTVRKNTGADTGNRRRLNLIEGTNVTLTVADDAANEEVDVTINSSGGGGGAPTTATYITQTADAGLANEQALAALATGILKNTTTTGVLSIAAAGVDFADVVHTHPVADITGEHAGTDLAADLEEEAHQAEHQSGGADALAGNIDANAATASALAANPTDCGANTFATTIAANGNLTCAGVAAAAITDDHAGTDITADLEEEAHQAEHQSGGADALAGNIDSVAKTTVRKNTGADVGSRRRLNLIEGTNVTLTVADDAANEEVDVTIDAAGGGGAPTTATYITQTADAGLANEQALSGLSSGIATVTTGTGVIGTITNSAGVAGQISDETGSGALVLGTSPTIVTPTIASFANATHNHQAAAGGGQLTDAALSAAVGAGKGGTGQTVPDADAILIGDGASWNKKTLPSCSDATTSKLLYNNSTDTISCGTDQGGGGGGFDPLTTRIFAASPVAGGTSFLYNHTGTSTTITTNGTTANNDDATARKGYVKATSSAVSGNNGSFSTGTGPPLYYSDPTVAFYVKTDASISNASLYVGLSGSVITTDTPAGAYFRFSSSAGDATNWQWVTSTGAAATVTDTGVAVSTSTRYTFKIVVSSGGTVISGYINGSLVRASQSPDNMPTVGANARPSISIVTREAVAKAISMGGIAMTWDY